MLCNVVNLPVYEISIRSFLRMALVFNLDYKWNYLGSFKIDFSSTLQRFRCNWTGWSSTAKFQHYQYGDILVLT